MKLETLLSQLKFQAAIEDVVKQKFTKNRRQIASIAETAYRSNDFDFPLCKRMPLTRLAVVVYLLSQKYAEYKAIGTTDEIILDTFSDVSLRANLYYKQHGKIGISKDDVIWFRHIMNVHIFKIGVLQYQTFNMIYLDEETIGEPYMVFTQEQKLVLPNGSSVINCHIQKGANISATLVNESIDQAKVFFKDCFPSIEYKAFLCYSWLLYPPMLNMLSDNSNIKQFAKCFSIIGECNDSEQAKENLFDYGKHNPPCKPTTLQRMGKEDNTILGYGCGVIML